MLNEHKQINTLFPNIQSKSIDKSIVGRGLLTPYFTKTPPVLLSSRFLKFLKITLERVNIS